MKFYHCILLDPKYYFNMGFILKIIHEIFYVFLS